MRAPSAAATGVIIETERLRMRAHRDDDLADLVALAGNWEIARWTAKMPHPYSETDGRGWIARVQEDHAMGRPRGFAIALKKTDRSAVWGLTLAPATAATSLRSAIGWASPIGATGMPGKRPRPSSTTGSELSGWKRSAPIPTQATWRRKGFFCTAA